MGTHYQGTDKEIRALDLIIKLVRVTESVMVSTKEVYTKAGLSESQFGVLEALYHLGPMPQKDIAHRILKSKGNLTLIINNLLKDKLVTKAQQPLDKRFASIEISPKGAQLIKNIFPEHVKDVVKAMSALDSEEQVQLSALCKKLGLSLSNKCL